MKKWLSKAKAWLIPAGFIIVFSIFWLKFAKPALLTFAKEQITIVLQGQNVVDVKFEELDFSIIKLQANASKIYVKVNTEPSLSPITADSLTAQLDFFNLLIGQVGLSKVVINNLDLKISPDADTSEKKTKSDPIKDILDIANKLPIDRVYLNQARVELLPTKDNTTIVAANINNAVVLNKKKQIDLQLQSAQFEIKANESSPPVIVAIKTDLSINQEYLNITNLNLTTSDSWLQLSGNLTNVSTITTRPTGIIKLKSQINLQDLRNQALLILGAKKRIPAVTGKTDLNGELKINGFNDLDGDLTIKTTQVMLDHLKLGQAELTARFKNNSINISKVDLEHPAGNASITDITIQPQTPYNLKAKINVEQLDLQKFFLSIGEKNIPAGFTGSGVLNCQGLLEPKINVDCSAETIIKNIWVKSSLKDTNHILKIKQARVNGDIKVSNEALTFKADILIGKSKSKSDGVVKFTEGFKINFETNKLDFNDIESLADLNLKGVLTAQGSTYGSSDFGVVNAKMKMENTEIDKFQLGTLTAETEYRAEHLYFRNLESKLNKSDLAGNITFDFANKNLNGSINSTNLYLQDVHTMLNKRFDLAFNLSGKGQAQIDFNGPFNFWKLKYNLNSHFTNGFIADEKYQTLHADIEANGNEVIFKNVELQKNKSKLFVTGVIATNKAVPEYQLKLNFNPLLLEESDHIVEKAPAITGIAFAEGTFSGTDTNPELKLNYTIKQLTYEKADYPNSQGNVTINKKNLALDGQFFGRQIQTNLLWPWNANETMNVKMIINGLNPLMFLPLISIPQPSADFNSKLSADINLTSPKRDLSFASGTIILSDLSISRGTQYLKLIKPSQMVFNSGLKQMGDIDLLGDESYLKLNLNESSRSQFKLNIDADIQLRLLHFLVPFTQSLSGNLIANSQVVFTDTSFELFGDGELVDGYVSLKNFPQAIEKLNTPIEFSKSKIFLSDITAQLGPSDLNGVGQIDIISAKKIQVSLKAEADNIELTFPEKIFTTGKANLSFTGDWIPYTLKVDYKIASGLVEKDFGQEEESATVLKASSFLPTQQFEDLSPSLTMDVNIDLSNGIIVKNQLIEGEAVGNLNILGSPENPIMKGRISLKPGSKLIFKDKPFDIQTANINFQGTNEVNPEIYMSANARVSDYDINLLVQGLSKNLIIKPTSQPPLAENEIISLVALGVTSDSSQTLNSEAQQTQTGLEVLAALSNQSQINKKIQQKLGLTLQLAPSIDSTKNIAVPKVVVSKKISNNLNASYSKPFTGNDQNQEVKLQYLYNKNLSVLLNYQNKDTGQQEQINNSTNNSKGILGLDFEYRDEFK